MQNELGVNYYILLIVIWSIMGGLIVYYIRSKRVERERISSLSEEQRTREVLKLSMDSEVYRTSHVLHFFITFFTFGGWLIPWIFFTLWNSSKRASIRRKANKVG